MRSNEVGNEVEGESPPNGAKDVASDPLHSSHEVDGVVHLWEELE